MGDAAEDAERRAYSEREEDGMAADVIEQDPVAEVDEGADVRPNLPAVPVVSTAMIARGELTVDDLVKQMETIEAAMNRVMKQNVHYGTIPGTDKPTLYQPGAQKLLVLFRLAPSFVTERTWDGDHLTVVSTCMLTHIPTGLLVATGDGLCTTKERRYGQRKSQRTCPACGAAQIKRSKFAPKENDHPGADPSDAPGWYCWRKEGGCGANFHAEDPAITGQEEGTIENPDLPELWNTILKMANKRALIAATINGTAASDVFTQDVEDAPAEGRPSASSQAAPRDAAQSGTGGASGQAATSQATAEPPDGWIMPSNYREVFERLTRVLGGGEMAEETVREWIGQAANELHSVFAVADLTDEERGPFMTRVVGVLRMLEDSSSKHGDLGFRTEGVRDLISHAFKVAFDVDLIGPEWRLDPSEATLPTYGEFKQDEKALAERSAAETDVDIPFGE